MEPERERLITRKHVDSLVLQASVYFCGIAMFSAAYGIALIYPTLDAYVRIERARTNHAVAKIKGEIQVLEAQATAKALRAKSLGMITPEVAKLLSQ
jgi:hypothetical protein